MALAQNYFAGFDEESKREIMGTNTGHRPLTCEGLKFTPFFFRKDNSSNFHWTNLKAGTKWK